MLRARRGEILIFSDIGCPWASLAVHRLHLARERAGLVDQVTFEHRAFPLELFNSRPTPKESLQEEVDLIMELEPNLGWSYWDDDDFRHPVTTLPALEAVQAARRQGLVAAEELDLELRGALFGRSRCISMHHEILVAAEGCPSVDVDQLDKALREGVARSVLFEQKEEAERSEVRGSPHVFLADGTGYHNPGVTLRWDGEGRDATPIVEEDDPAVLDEIIERASS